MKNVFKYGLSQNLDVQNNVTNEKNVIANDAQKLLNHIFADLNLIS